MSTHGSSVRKSPARMGEPHLPRRYARPGGGTRCDRCPHIASIYDPETARQAQAAGAGATVAVRLGGKTDTLHGAPIETEAYVKCLTDGRFRLTTPMGHGMQVDLGPTVRLVIGGVDVLVASARQQVLDDELFLLNGIDVRRGRIVALKCVHITLGHRWMPGTSYATSKQR